MILLKYNPRIYVSEKIKQIVINPRRKAETFLRNVT